MQRVAVLTSGGDAPGMNACIRAIVRCASAKGLEVVGIKRGFSGLIAREAVELGPREVSNILQSGGTFLGTSRCAEMLTAEGRRRALQFLEEQRVDGLLALGGDGTFRGAAALADEGSIKVLGVPATIDNDVYGTDFSIGFDTALNTALESIDRIRDTAQSLERLFFVEVMGRTRGFIALHTGLATGADEILIPEIEEDIEELCQSLRRGYELGKKSLIVLVAEGGTPGRTQEIAREVGRKTGYDYRVCILGHVQRGGSPTARDRILASKLGLAAVEALLEGKNKQMVGEVRGQLILTPLEETWQRRKEFDAGLLDLLKLLAT